MTVRRNAFGRQVDSFEEDVDVDGSAGGPVHAVFIRAPWVRGGRPGGQALGRVSAGPPPVGSWRFARATCWPRRSTRS